MHKSLIFPKEIFSVVIRRSLQERGSFLIIFANLQICKSAPPPQPSSSQQINAKPFFLLILLFTNLSHGDSVAENLIKILVLCFPVFTDNQGWANGPHYFRKVFCLISNSVASRLCWGGKSISRLQCNPIIFLSFSKAVLKKNTIHLNIANVNIFEFCLFNLQLCYLQSRLVKVEV